MLLQGHQDIVTGMALSGDGETRLARVGTARVSHTHPRRCRVRISRGSYTRVSHGSHVPCSKCLWEWGMWHS